VGDRCPYWLTTAFVKTNNLPKSDLQTFGLSDLPTNKKYTPADEINTEVISYTVN
jgi:hypothetical protein